MSNNIGKVVQVIGPVVDVRFDAGHLTKLSTTPSTSTMIIRHMIDKNCSRGYATLRRRYCTLRCDELY